MADTFSQAEVKTRYPVTSGIIAGTTKQEGRSSRLVPEGLHGVKSIVPNRTRAGID